MRAEKQRERGAKALGTSGPSRRPQEPAVYTVQDATVPGQSASGEAEDVGSKASSLGRQRKPQASKQTAAGNPEPPPPTKLSPGLVGWGNTGN